MQLFFEFIEGIKIMIGIVKWYDIRKGYGFIKDKNGTDIFVHKSDVPFWTIFLRRGDKVEFQIKDTSNGFKAIDIKMK